MNSIQASIVIVCMNNLKNLYPCLDSIRKYTTISYETFVVAYLFTKENLNKLCNDFPWVTIVESNEIRGFSENNNLALRQARGKYCFVVNDDTKMKMPVIDRLIDDFDKVEDNVAIISPMTVYTNGTVQMCGRGKYNFLTYVIGMFHLSKFINFNNKYTNHGGLFQSWNISGSAFLIKTDLFRKVGWFDEQYFFCPEDLAVSETLNKMGYECWVDADVQLIHYEGMSTHGTSIIVTAVKPAGRAGSIAYLTNHHWWKEIYVRPILAFQALAQSMYHFWKYYVSREKNHKIFSIAYYNSIYAAFSTKTPKQIFKKYYYKIKK